MVGAALVVTLAVAHAALSALALPCAAFGVIACAAACSAVVQNVATDAAHLAAVVGTAPYACATGRIFLSYMALTLVVAAALARRYDRSYAFGRASGTQRVAWPMCVYLLAVHVAAFEGACRVSGTAMALEVIAWWQVSALGITAGMHRLWSHRSYAATAPLRAALAALASVCNQGSIYHWCRDHRVHHKYAETTADPHDSSRGFFYAHVGWLLLCKSEATKAAGRKIPTDDVMRDPIVRFNRWASPWLDLALCFGMPAVYGHYVHGDAALGALVFGALRYCIVLHATWMVNSVAHFYGGRPYDAKIAARENAAVTVLAVGEGYHNWHHKFPRDYACSEHGPWNPTKALIDAAALVGLCSDRNRPARALKVA
jgi:stearoyl-CoA desaturase (delta-9 desaturase)